MAKFYFTYGLYGQPYVGGWTEITAPDIKTACNLFKAVHPCKVGDLLNCASMYVEEQFKMLSMYENGNYGHKCRERIIYQIEGET